MNLEALKGDAGGMLDVLSQLVDAFDDGRITGDIVVNQNGCRLYLISELAREFVDKHADAKVTVMSDAVAKTDLLVRLELAQIASCTCITKTPFYGAHRLDCRYRILVEAKDRIDRLERAISAHNASMECGCNLNRRKDRCDSYLDRGQNCPDCPCGFRIILLDF